jgi:hypothetical protein
MERDEVMRVASFSFGQFHLKTRECISVREAGLLPLSSRDWLDW